MQKRKLQVLFASHGTAAVRLSGFVKAVSTAEEEELWRNFKLLTIV